ncbi:2OG-Fe(II) oxygenase [Leekyejoonella antrihumi]|uniref:2OG-Fe(II) oxygenase n=1 Tax=Leekyejoonella antrihumi TaxID=1660198 RepID=A0A563E7P2_9MICO|nr:2OG-Fe(II) oxygenase [Leekyejoonella antrihumi]TWP38222.1 2OG-Fe(II) oxygenase [Leekyejoonella antrihumi]
MTMPEPRTLQAVNDLQPLLQARRWRWRATPFPHIVAENVFVPDVQEELARDFRTLYDQRTTAGYNTQHDFLGTSLISTQCGSLEVFISPAWYALFTRLFGINEPGFLTAGVHRHRPGSRNGFPHNDIFPERLDVGPGRGDVLRFGGPVAGKSVRAVAILYYLNNGPWAPGDGGETSLYWDWKDGVDTPVDSVPPRDNTLFAFSCNPHSYHSFRTNRKRRDSVISFVYRGVDDYVQLWGDEGLRQYAEYGRHHA